MHEKLEIPLDLASIEAEIWIPGESYRGIEIGEPLNPALGLTLKHENVHQVFGWPRPNHDEVHVEAGRVSSLHVCTHGRGVAPDYLIGLTIAQIRGHLVAFDCEEQVMEQLDGAKDLELYFGALGLTIWFRDAHVDEVVLGKLFET